MYSSQRGGWSSFTVAEALLGGLRLPLDKDTMAVDTGERDPLSRDLNQERKREREREGDARFDLSDQCICIHIYDIHAEIRTVPLTAAR